MHRYLPMRSERCLPLIHFKSWLVLALWVVALAVSFSCIAFGAAPVARDDSATIDEDISFLIDVLANDSDADGDPLTIASVTAPEHGTTSIEWSKIRYAPDPNTYGTDSFSYTVTDGTDTDTAEVTITVIWINDAPVAVDDLQSTRPEIPVSFSLTATDVDVDPFTPERHPLEFKILVGPAHGEISGDLTEVTYEFPHTGYVNVTYTPATGFTGKDSITFSVTDPTGASDTAVVEIVVARREMGALAGTWDTSITFEGEPFEISALSSTLTAIYRLGKFVARGEATWSDGSFSSLTFNSELPLGELVTVKTTLAFDPDDSPFFDYWQTVTNFSFSDIRFTHTFYLPENSDSSYHRLVARTRIGDVSLTSTTRFTGWGLAFDKQEFRARLKWCDLSLDAKLSIECEEGFDEFSLTVRDIPILCTEECDSFAITLRLETTFTTTSKTIEPTITCRSDWIECLKVLCELVIPEDNDMSIEGISLYGLKLRSHLFESIEINMGISFAESKNSSATGYSDYFAKWMLSGPTTPCCGSPGKWQIATYLQSGESESTRFGWGMSTFELETALIEQVRLSTKLTFRAEDPHWKWTGSLKVVW